MISLKSYKRYAVLGLLTFGILLWTRPTSATADFLQIRSAAAKFNPKQSTTIKADVLEEQFSFLIKDFKIDHQGEHNNLNIEILLHYKPGMANSEYPDFMLIARDIEALLTNYPEVNDYWEIVNKKLTLMVLEKYPAVAKITSQIKVSPTANDPYQRSSISTRERATMRKRSNHSAK